LKAKKERRGKRKRKEKKKKRPCQFITHFLMTETYSKHGELVSHQHKIAAGCPFIIYRVHILTKVF